MGLLVNFGLQKVVVKGIPFSEKEKRINENYDFIKELLVDNDRKVSVRVRVAILIEREYQFL